MSLRLLAPGTGPDGNATPAIDIVAVHGLNPINSTDHAFNTWRKPLDDAGCLWLRDCFPKAQPNARIYLYEYNSSPVFGAAKDSFVGEANQLLDEIYGERWQMNGDTPLILMGHSLGGILIKQALVNAWANEKYRGIKEATHALVFFGTPHTGPSRNMQVGLGMACGRIARSLPFKQTSKIIEILEGGTLFSDLLSESFRHQLEQYKILSCYEGFGDIVPFDSAVLGLPGKRETQLRINADHSNMCRFDMTVQVDKDNYRKVERNLQILCADALVKTTGESATSDVPMNNIAFQGGVDLFSVLLRQLDPGANINGNLLIRRFADAPDFAWQIYRLCEQSRAAAFAEAASDVSRLFIGVRSLKDRLETDTFSMDNSPEIGDVMSKCCRTLQAFQSVIDIYHNTPRRSRAHWDSNSSREEFYGLKTLKMDLQGNISMINTLNRDLARRSMNDLTQRLDEVIDMLNGGDENLSSLSNSLSRTSLSEVQSWSDVCPDLVDAGLSRSILSEQRGYIQQWLMNAVKAGRIDVESSPDHASRTVRSTHLNNGDAPACTNRSESLRAFEDEIRSPFPNTDSVLVHHQPGDWQQLDSSAPATKHASKAWAHSLTSKLRYRTLHSDDAIRRAVKSGDISSVKKILASTNTIDPAWVIRIAAHGRHIAVLRDLKTLGLFVGQNDELRSCLSYAISRKHVETMAFLLENDSSFETEDLVYAMPFASESEIETMLGSIHGNLDHETYAHLLLYTAAKHDHKNAFRSLVAQYGGINAAVNETTPLHLACRSGNARSIQLALDLGANVRLTDARGDGPLHALVLGGGDPRFEIGATIMLLVRNGTLLRGESGDGQTALHLAAKCAHIKAMEALIQMGLSPHIQTTEVKAPLHYACKSERAERTVEHWLPGYLTLETKLKRRRTQLFILSEKEYERQKAMQDPRKDTFSGEKAEDAVRLLLHYGASVNFHGIDNVTPLLLALEKGNSGVIKALLQHGADVQAVDDWGWTSLHYAIVGAEQDAINLIIPYDLDPKKSASVKILGEHRKQLSSFELLNIVNGCPWRRMRLVLGPVGESDGDTTDGARSLSEAIRFTS